MRNAVMLSLLLSGYLLLSWETGRSVIINTARRSEDENEN